MLDSTQVADIVKIDRPVNLDGFAQDLFCRLAERKESADGEEVAKIKTAILRERIDRIDKMNNILKQYLSDYYIVVYGRNELDLENTTINVASEINKCGLNTKLLGRKETAIFLKYSFFRNFDEREIKEVEDNRLIDWVKPKKVEFKANGYTVDGTQAAAGLLMEDNTIWQVLAFRLLLPLTKQRRLLAVHLFQLRGNIQIRLHTFPATRVVVLILFI